MTEKTLKVGFTYDTVAVGQKARSAARTVTEADHSMFMMLTGAWHPIHCDEPFAKSVGAKGRMVQGTFGIALALGGHLESEILHSADPLVAALGLVDWRYKGPIYVGDTLHLDVEIVDRKLTSDGTRYTLDRKVSLVNQDNVVVQEGIARSMWRKTI